MGLPIILFCLKQTSYASICCLFDNKFNNWWSHIPKNNINYQYILQKVTNCGLFDCNAVINRQSSIKFLAFTLDDLLLINMFRQMVLDFSQTKSISYCKMQRHAWKCEAGANFFLAQSVYLCSISMTVPLKDKVSKL